MPHFQPSKLRIVTFSGCDLFDALKPRPRKALPECWRIIYKLMAPTLQFVIQNDAFRRNCLRKLFRPISSHNLTVYVIPHFIVLRILKQLNQFNRFGVAIRIFPLERSVR